MAIASTGNARRAYTEEQWNEIKPHFIKLYRDEKNTLKHTMDRLREKYDFKDRTLRMLPVFFLFLFLGHDMVCTGRSERSKYDSATKKYIETKEAKARTIQIMKSHCHPSLAMIAPLIIGARLVPAR